jgi:hypothetical protein
MTYTAFVLLLLLAASSAHAECGSTAYRAGCNTQHGAIIVGPNGTSTYNKNNGTVHTTNGNSSGDTVAPGTNIYGRRGNSATKALEPGCAWVNGRKVCN